VSEPERLRIAYTIEQCWHRVPGGTAVAAIGMADALEQRGDISLVGVAAAHRRPPPEPFAPSIEVKHVPLPRPALYEAWHRLRAPRVERVTGEVDLIHATTLAVPPKSRPLVVTIHDLAWLERPQHFTARGVRFFNRGLELALGDADLVLCPSEATRRDCLGAGWRPEKVRVVPFGVSASPATETDVTDATARYGLHLPYVLWTGTVEPRKNLGGLLDAFAAIDTSHELVLVGPEGWNENLAARIDAGGGRVRRLGFVPQADLAALYAGAAVFCFPSFTEGFGFPILEAMVQGTPVVTSRGTSTEELAGDAAVLIDPGDSGSIADGLRSVLEDGGLARKLADAGPGRAARYSWRATAEMVADAYAEVAA
jgi:glycosyltransferase involved in cell wall biosynthesis